MDPVIRYDFGNVFVYIIYAGGIGNILFILVVQIMRLKLIIKHCKLKLIIKRCKNGCNCCKNRRKRKIKPSRIAADFA